MTPHCLGSPVHGERDPTQLGEVWILRLREIAKLLSESPDFLPFLLGQLLVVVEKFLPFDPLAISQLEVVGRRFEATVAARRGCSFATMELFDSGRLSGQEHG
jgi:hypothetical protein